MKRISNFILFISFLCAINFTTQAQNIEEDSALENIYTALVIAAPLSHITIVSA